MEKMRSSHVFFQSNSIFMLHYPITFILATFDIFYSSFIILASSTVLDCSVLICWKCHAIFFVSFSLPSFHFISYQNTVLFNYYIVCPHYNNIERSYVECQSSYVKYILKKVSKKWKELYFSHIIESNWSINSLVSTLHWNLTIFDLFDIIPIVLFW